MRHRLRKKDRITQAGKGCNAAQYVWGKPKRREKVFGSGGMSPEARRDATVAFAKKHSTIGKR